MKMVSLKFSEETKSLIYIILILGLVFGFNDGSGSFVFSNWLNNFLSTLILVAVVVLTFFVGMKIASKLFNYGVEFGVWELKYYGFSEESKFPYKVKIVGFEIFRLNFLLPIGIIIALLITLISNGILYFTAIFTVKFKEKKKIGKERIYLKGFTKAAILSIVVLIMLILNLLFKVGGIERGFLIGFWFIIWNLMPVGSLIGSKIFFGSRVLYFGLLIFVLLFSVILAIIPSFLGLLIALLFSILAMIVYFYKFYRQVS